MSAPLILVVDDEPNIRETISFILEMEGFRVAMAEDGEQALAQVRLLRPPVVLLDAMMPRRDGFDVCRAIKGDPALAGTHVVMLTAMGQQRDRDRAREAGADHFMTKPFDEVALLALLHALTSKESRGSAP